MKTFKNKAFIKRDHEASNLIFLQTDKLPFGYSENWKECKAEEIEKLKCKQLYKMGTCTYFGYL